ncbi:hypothetical protein N7532_009655 [Penicillium argentinense]|uniref:Uncharacterized protein n=1 Tax=Penicillium argentinense TaxID=1131581 RepID=A0A9W9EZV9_9EURO|nr:uncharacterized protein N7532_009655 [Penicillium argentinense]KAJ5090971.1 hypothetical protein N7532_009655 [Penicillium argentinense]
MAVYMARPRGGASLTQTQGRCHRAPNLLAAPRKIILALLHNVDRPSKPRVMIRHRIAKCPKCQARGGSDSPVRLRVDAHSMVDPEHLRGDFLAVRTATWRQASQES